MKPEEFLEKINELLNAINLLAPTTKNNLVNQLKIFQMQLLDPSYDTIDEKVVQQSMILGERLLNNLHFAQEAVKYTSDRMKSTNYDFYDIKNNTELERYRFQFNNLDVKNLFGFFQRRREEIAKNSPPALDFEQSAYRRSTGINMSQWYRHAHTPPRGKKWGNCTEQSNISFVYLYTRVREIISAGKASPIRSLQRIDVDNKQGGHCYILIDGMNEPLFQIKKNFTENEHLELISSLHHTEVIVDPWNTAHPFYPAADILQYLPECGFEGNMNVEFGLGCADHEGSPRRKITCKM